MAPDAFVCPITRDVMDRPVVAADGHSYEHDAIARWLARNARSPLSNAPMGPELVPNITLRKAIAEWRERPDATQVAQLQARDAPVNALESAAAEAEKMRREICDLESRLKSVMKAQRRSARDTSVVVRACRLYEAQHEAAQKEAAEKARVSEKARLERAAEEARRAAEEARHAAYRNARFEEEQEKHRAQFRAMARGVTWEFGRG